MVGRQWWAGIARAGVVVAVVATAMGGCAKAAPPQQSSSPAVSSAPASSGSPAAPVSGATSSPGPASSAATSGAGTPGTATGPGGSASAGTPGSGSAPATSAAGTVANVALTPDLAHQILVAAATFNKLPVTAYVGLMPNLTYVGRDASGTIWAGAALEPSPSSVPAQVSVQDDGSYLLLRRRSGGDWTVWSVGLASAADCAKFGLPGALRTLWGWPATGCRPHQ